MTKSYITEDEKSSQKYYAVVDRFKYIDDLCVLQLILLSGLLMDYNFSQHVASDIGIDEQFLPPDTG